MRCPRRSTFRLAFLADALEENAKGLALLRATAIAELGTFIRSAPAVKSGERDRPIPDAELLVAARVILDRIDPAIDPDLARRRDDLLALSIALRNARPVE